MVSSPGVVQRRRFESNAGSEYIELEPLVLLQIASLAFEHGQLNSDFAGLLLRNG